MNTDRLSHGGTAWRTELGALGIWPPQSGVLVVALQGHGARVFAAPILAAYEQIPRPTPVHLFLDFERLVDYEPPLRTELVLHLFADRHRISGTHVLIKSHPSGTMLGAAISAFRGTVDLVEAREPFEALLDQRLILQGVSGFSSSALRAFADS